MVDAAGMQDFHMDANGALVPVNGRELPDGALTGPITQPMNLINGVMVVQTMTGNALSENNLAGNNLATNGLSSNELATNGLSSNELPSDGAAGNGAPSIGELLPAVCPVGFYSDNAATACTSLGASEPACLDGFAFDDATKTCMSTEADGNYPGCPAGQIFDPSTGLCDTQTSFVSTTELHHIQVLQVDLPDCAKDTREKEGGAAECVPGYNVKCP